MITVIGSANVDHVIHTDRMPVSGETVVGRNYAVNAGGKGLNQAVAAAKLGGNVQFFGMLGHDEGGRMLCDVMTQAGVRFIGECVRDVPTGVAVITVADGDNAIVLSAGANACMTPDVIVAHETMIAQSDYVVMQLEIPLDTVRTVCEIAARHGTKVVLNPAPYLPLDEGILSTVDWVIPNEHEAAAMTGMDITDVPSAVRAVECLKEKGANGVVITLGGNGCVYTDGDTVCHQPAVKTTVVDTTSAGDCFIGAFVSRLADGFDVPRAVAFATKAAAVTVSRHGAAASIPYASEIA